MYENYFSSSHTILQSLLGVIQNRLTIPASPVKETPSPSVFNSSFTPPVLEFLPNDVEPEEILGPVETPFPSPTFRYLSSVF